MNEEEKQVIDDMLHGSEDPAGEQAAAGVKALGDTIREYIRRGNVTRIIVKRRDEALVNIPLNAGIVGSVVGAVAAPWAVIAAAIAAAGFDCRVEIVRDDGEIVDLSARRLGETLRSAGTTVAEEFRDAFGSMKDAAAGGMKGAWDAPSVDEEIPFADVDDSESADH